MAYEAMFATMQPNISLVFFLVLGRYTQNYNEIFLIDSKAQAGIAKLAACGWQCTPKYFVLCNPLL
jgi:hypothetical protein